MRKITLILAAVSFIAVACTKEGLTDPVKSGEPPAVVDEPDPDPNPDPDSLVDVNRIRVVSGGDLNGQLVAMNESFTLPGKAVSLSYTYKVYAEPPTVNGLSTASTAVVANDKYVFVSWHTEGAAHGGALSVYEYNGTDYQYVARVDFDDTDWHDLTVIKDGSNYDIIAAGQRNRDSSNYLLANHFGAVSGKITFTPGASSFFDVTDYRELPLPSYGANGIINDGSSVVVVTGNGQGLASPRGGAFRIPAASFDYVSQAKSLTDCEFISEDGSDMYVLNRTSATSLELQTASLAADVATLGLATGATASIASTDNDRNASAFYGSDLLVALGTQGIFRYDVSGNSFGMAKHIGSAALGLDYDTNGDLIYVGAGGGGVYVLAGAGYATGKALINEFDVVGKFIPPSSAPFNSNFSVKDVSIYLNAKIAVASGNGGMFFVDMD